MGTSAHVFGEDGVEDDDDDDDDDDDYDDDDDPLSPVTFPLDCTY